MRPFFRIGYRMVLLDSKLYHIPDYFPWTQNEPLEN
jgi:hypothetical protein